MFLKPLKNEEEEVWLVNEKEELDPVVRLGRSGYDRFNSSRDRFNSGFAKFKTIDLTLGSIDPVVGSIDPQPLVKPSRDVQHLDRSIHSWDRSIPSFWNPGYATWSSCTQSQTHKQHQIPRLYRSNSWIDKSELHSGVNQVKTKRRTKMKN